MKNLRAALILQGLWLMVPNQTAVAQTPESNLSFLQATNLPAQKIGSDDLIAISVYDSPELTRTVRV